MKKIYSLLLMLCMANSMLFATDYFVAGTMNGWNHNKMTQDATNTDIWTYEFTAEANQKYEFKVTIGGWIQPEYNSDNIDSQSPIQLSAADGKNIAFTPSEGGDVIITFNSNTTKISVRMKSSIVEDYYIKHPWNSGNWSWKKLTADEGGTTYSIREIYGSNGNSGCNWNTHASDDGAKWEENPTLEGGVAVGDSAVFTLDPSKGTITITKIVVPAVANYSVVLINGDKSSSYDMIYDTEEETPSYNYILRNVAAGVYQFVIKDSKNNVYDWDKHETSPTIELEQGENNHIKFTLTKESNVAFVYDSKDSKVWIFTKAVGNNKVEYYISGTCTPNNWDSPHTLMTEEDADNAIWSYTFDAKAGERYEFKITTGAWHWASNPLYEYKEYNAEFIDKDNSSIYLEGWQTDQYNNISFELQEDMTVKIVFDGNKYKVMAQKACSACLKLELI